MLDTVYSFNYKIIIFKKQAFIKIFWLSLLLEGCSSLNKLFDQGFKTIVIRGQKIYLFSVVFLKSIIRLTEGINEKRRLTN